ncbi:MAG: hypothetical protein ACI4D8_08880 [Wujia sp.]
MNCKVCGEVIEDGVEYCPVCGACIASFSNVQPDKIIYNQSPSVQNYVGDDDVTQLIPQNYGTVQGDDDVTQLIPQNYGAAQGDDDVTQLIPQNYGAVQGDDSVTQLIQEGNGFLQYQNNSVNNNMSYATEIKKKSSGGLIAGIIACVVVAIAVVVMLVVL